MGINSEKIQTLKDVLGTYDAEQHIKGREGEERVAKALAQIGYKVVHVGGAVRYSIDGLRFFCADLLPFGKGDTFWVQVKRKEPRIYYPDTGLELWRFNALFKHEWESGRKVLVLFTDDSNNPWVNAFPNLGTERIYGEWLSNLSTCRVVNGNQNNQYNGKEMVYFDLAKLKSYKTLFGIQYAF